MSAPAVAYSEPAAASDAGYRITLPTRRSPNVAQAVLLASALAQLGLALAITIYLARVLSPAAFGFFALVSTIFILARKFLDLGLGSVAAREIAAEARRERPILEGMMAYRRAAGLFLMLALFIFAFAQKSATERGVLLAAGVVLLFTEPAALDPVFQVRQAQGGPAVLNLSGGLLVLGGSLLFRRLAMPGTAFAWLLVLREAVTLLFTKLLAERLLGYHPRPGFRGRALRAFVAPAFIFGLASLVYTIYFHGDVFFVDALRGPAELGAYAAAFRPINPLLLLPWLLMSPMVPVLTVVARQDRERFVRQVRGACRLALGLGACGLVAGTLLAPDLLQLLYRGRYLAGPLSTVAAFRWLSVALGQVCVTTVLTASLLADRKEKLLLAIGTSALLLNAALNLVLLRHHNFTAAGFATAASELLFLICALVAFQLVTRHSALTWDALLYLLPAAVMGAIVYFAVLHLTTGGAVLRVVFGIVLGVVAVTAILLSPAARRFRKEMAALVPPL
ncbi:MAG TPA: oligosaccharide flippase family protein [Terriglobales bacterium]|nr:oligosaccharide flippase family protein [Terriglobales bacterium]